MSPEERLPDLWSKVDAFFARVGERYPDALACAEGCADCCHRELTITPIEAVRITELLHGMPAATRAELASRAERGEPCAALDEQGRCAVYAARPLVCRSHGVPLRFVEPDAAGKRALPMLDVCPKNFIGHDLAQVDATCVLDQRTLSVMLGALDALFARAAGEPEGRRVALRDVLRLSAAAGLP